MKQHCECDEAGWVPSTRVLSEDQQAKQVNTS